MWSITALWQQTQTVKQRGPAELGDSATFQTGGTMIMHSNLKSCHHTEVSRFGTKTKPVLTVCIQQPELQLETLHSSTGQMGCCSSTIPNYRGRNSHLENQQVQQDIKGARWWRRCAGLSLPLCHDEGQVSHLLLTGVNKLHPAAVDQLVVLHLTCRRR